MASLGRRNTRSKIALQEERSKDTNAGVFTDSSGRIFENQIIWTGRFFILFSIMMISQAFLMTSRITSEFEAHRSISLPPNHHLCPTQTWWSGKFSTLTTRSEFSMTTLVFFWPRSNLIFLQRLTCFDSWNNYWTVSSLMKKSPISIMKMWWNHGWKTLDYLFDSHVISILIHGSGNHFHYL